MLITMEITVGQQLLEHFGLILGAESRLNKSLKDTSGGTLSKLQELEQWPMSLIQNLENGTMLLYMQVALFILHRIPNPKLELRFFLYIRGF